MGGPVVAALLLGGLPLLVEGPVLAMLLVKQKGSDVVSPDSLCSSFGSACSGGDS